MVERGSAGGEGIRGRQNEAVLVLYRKEDENIAD
jgi:hypothetical protein